MSTSSDAVDRSKESRACLLPPSMSQNTPMFEDEQGFCDAGLLRGALFRLTPLQGLDLNLPVDPSKAAALLQHSLHHMAAHYVIPKGQTQTCWYLPLCSSLH